VFPLGNPYGVPNYRRTPNRGLQGVFGPRIPEVSDHPAPMLDTRQGEPNVWTPQPASYVAKVGENIYNPLLCILSISTRLCDIIPLVLFIYTQD